MDKRIKKIFSLYESGRANENERKIVEDWFAIYDQGKPTDLSEEDKKVLFKPVDDQIKKIVKQSGNNGFTSYRWLAIAATVLVAFGISLFLLRNIFQRTDQPVTYNYITTPKGKKTTFSLPDGSVISLNSGSSIGIPSNFNQKSRAVTLSGEAYFTINHNQSMPFSIQTEKLLITDLGTAFDVKAYPEENRISVAVESGIVRVEKNTIHGKKEVYAREIKGNQELVYNKIDHRHTMGFMKAENLIAWHKNQLFFINASFDEIAPMLERWYDVTVKLEHKAGQCRRYTVSFNNEPIARVLNVLEKLSGAKYRIENNVVIINLKNCKK